MVVHGRLSTRLIWDHLHVVRILFLEGPTVGRKHIHWPQFVSDRKSPLFRIIDVTFFVFTWEHVLLILRVRLDLMLIWDLVCYLILRVVLIGLVDLGLRVKFMPLYHCVLITALRGKRLGLLLCFWNWRQIYRSWQRETCSRRALFGNSVVDIVLWTSLLAIAFDRARWSLAIL